MRTCAALAGSGRSEAHQGDGDRDDGEETHFDRVEFIECFEVVVVELREADRSDDDDAMLNRYCVAVVLPFIFFSVYCETQCYYFHLQIMN